MGDANHSHLGADLVDFATSTPVKTKSSTIRFPREISPVGGSVSGEAAESKWNDENDGDDLSNRLQQSFEAQTSSQAPFSEQTKRQRPVVIAERGDDSRNINESLPRASRTPQSQLHPVDLSSLSLLPLSECFPSITEMKLIFPDDVHGGGGIDDARRRALWFPVLVKRLGVDPSRVSQVWRMEEKNRECAPTNEGLLENCATSSPGDATDGEAFWESASAVERRMQALKHSNTLGSPDDDDRSSAGIADEFAEDGWWKTTRPHEFDFVDSGIPNFHRARLYASGRRRGAENLLDELKRYRTKIAEKVEHNQQRMRQFNNCSSGLAKTAGVLTELASDLSSRLHTLSVQFERYESSASEWQTIKHNAEHGMKTLVELRKHIDVLERADFYLQQHTQLLIHQPAGTPAETKEATAEFQRYLDALLQLGPTLHFLSNHTEKQHPLLQRADALLQNATEKLLFTFQQLLSQSNTQPIMIVDSVRNELLSEANDEMVGETVGMSSQLAEHDPVELVDYSASAYDRMRSISTWLHQARQHYTGPRGDFAHVYHQVRDQMLSQSMTNLTSYLRNNPEWWMLSPVSTGTAGDGESARTGSAESIDQTSGDTTQRAVQQGRMRKRSQAPRAGHSGLFRAAGDDTAGSGVAGRKMNVAAKATRKTSVAVKATAVSTIDDDTIQELDILLVTCLSLLKLLQVEAMLAHEFIPEREEASVFERIANNSMQQLVESARRVEKRISAFHDGHDYQSVMYVLQALSWLERMKSAFERLLGRASEVNFTRWLDIVQLVEASAWHGIELFLEQIRRPDSQSVPHDGAVHELAIRAMALVGQMHAWTNLCGRLFVHRAGTDEEWASCSPEEAFPRFLATILASINSTIMTRCHAYSDTTLARIFIVNNYSYMIKVLKASKLLTEVQRVEPHIERYLTQQCEQAQADYQQCWQNLLDAIHELLAHDVVAAPLRSGYQSSYELSGRERESIKQKCAIIRRELDDTYKRQIEYNVPDPTVREQLVAVNRQLIGEPYRAFYENYLHIEFTTNRKKYMPYTPADVNIMLEHFFSGGAKYVPRSQLKIG